MQHQDELLKKLETLEKSHPLPTSWCLTAYACSVMLVCCAMYMALELDMRWWALLPFLMASPLITFGLVEALGVTFLGRPKGWPPEESSHGDAAR